VIQVAAKKYTSDDLLDLLHNKYNLGNGYLVLKEVGNATGCGCNRHADAIVFGIWPSVGLRRSAFEIKVDRSDFLHEVQHPDKSQWAKDCCHEFWFLTPPDGVIKDVNELPENCGWMKPRGSGLTIVRAASVKEKPDLDDAYLASFIRAAVQQIQGRKTEIIQKAIHDSVEFKQARAWETASKKFLNERGGRDYLYKADEIFEELCKATLDKSMQKDKDHIMQVLDNFRDHMLQTLAVFGQIASHSILSTDELGNHILDVYGSAKDESTLAALKAKLKKVKKTDRYTRDQLNRKIQLLELVSVFNPKEK